MYTEGTLRPPSPKETQEKYLPLETLDLAWYDKYHWNVQDGSNKVGDARADTDNAEPTMAELVNFMIQNSIPVSARIVYHECGSHQLALDWTED